MMRLWVANAQEKGDEVLREKSPQWSPLKGEGRRAGFMAAKVVDTILTLNGTFHGVTHKNLQEYVSEF